MEVAKFRDAFICCYILFFYKFDSMKEKDADATIVDGYIELLENLSTDNKLDLISKLSTSIKENLTSKGSLIKEAFGAFDSAKSAEEIIDEIRSSRVFTRQIESF